MPGKTISFMKIAALVAFVHFACCAAEQTLLSIDFDQQTFPVKTLTGSWEKNSMGINVDADSRIAIQIPARLQVKNGSVRVGFLPPEYKKARIPGEPRAEDCSCALKLYAGRCFAEVTDRGLSLKRLDPTFSYVDTTFGTVSRVLDPLAGEMTLSLSILDLIAVASLNDSTKVSAPAGACTLGSIEIATYLSPFILTDFTAVSLSRDTLFIDKRNKYIELGGIYHPSRFNAGDGQHNHSFITWEGGLAATNALFTTFLPDSTVYDALVSIGAVPGNNLTYYPWSEISNPRNPGPDRKALGPSVAVEICYGGKSYQPSAFLHDENGKPFSFRFSGNKKFIPEMRTGCIVCLESCPGGKIGNATYTMRDLVKKAARFTLLTVPAIEDEAEVTIRISLKQ
jgi:hypothetical protein